MPSISIVLPVYNGARFLAEALASCLGQSCRDLEVIVVDDGSSDNTLAIAEAAAHEDERVKIVRHPANKGLPAALNSGFAVAQGAYFTWTSDDNLFKPHALERMAAFLQEQPAVDIVFCDADVIDENGCVTRTVVTGPWEDLPIGDYLGACFLYRREVDERAGGYDEGQFCVEDYAFWLSAYNAGCRFAHLAENLYQYREHGRSLSATRQKTVLRKTLNLIMENNAAHAAKIPDDILMRSYLRCTSIAMVLADRATAQECFRRAVDINPDAPDRTRPELVAYATDDAPPRTATPVQHACGWILKHLLPGGGLAATSALAKPYPEVSGYVVPTLIDYGFRREALGLCAWLAKVQQADGTFLEPHGRRTYLFDTAQVLRGFLAIAPLTDRYQENARRAAEALFKGLQNGPCFPRQWEDAPEIPDSTMLFALPPMLDYARQNGDSHGEKLIYRCAEAYLEEDDALSTASLTHYLGYQIDGLLDIGLGHRAAEAVEALLDRQRADGGIPAFDGAQWTCTTGLAQLAIILYKLDRKEAADRIMTYLDAKQNAGGGFWGSLGSGAAYFPQEEPSWGVKFYLDAYRQRIVSFFDHDFAPIAPHEIGAQDGRVLALAEEIRATKARKVLEVGCGKGRILKRLRELFPECAFAGLDISPVLLDYLPEGIERLDGWAENIPCADGVFDLVYALDALEHAVNQRGAVEEMLRVAAPGSAIVIIDKQRAHWGRLPCPPWEIWPERSVLEKLLGEYCSQVRSEPVPYEGGYQGDEMLIKWSGKKV